MTDDQKPSQLCGWNDERIRVTRARLNAEIMDLREALESVKIQVESLQTRLGGLRGVTERVAKQADTLAYLTLEDEVIMTEKQIDIMYRFCDAVCALFENDRFWSVLDLDGAKEFFDLIEYTPSPEATHPEYEG